MGFLSVILLMAAATLPISEAGCDDADGVDLERLGAVYCAGEREYCDGPGTVYYGYDTHWVTVEVARGESLQCSWNVIGCDPYSGKVKSCYILNKCNDADGEDPEELGAVHCADENGDEYCDGPGTVYYGNGTHWTAWKLSAEESVLCSDDGFGCDPIPEAVKDCYILNTCDDADGADPQALGAVICGDENDYCEGPGIVYYGHGTDWTTKYLDNGESLLCSDSDIGCDPIPETAKNCYIYNCDFADDGVDPEAEGAVACDNEDGVGLCEGPGTVYYGNGSHWTIRELSSSDSVLCTNDGLSCNLVSGDEAECYILNNCDDADGVDPQALGAVHCADEGGSCEGPGTVYYGVGEHWTTKVLDRGESLQCKWNVICDPKHGDSGKACYIISSPPTMEPTPIPIAPTPNPSAGPTTTSPTVAPSHYVAKGGVSSTVWSRNDPDSLCVDDASDYAAYSNYKWDGEIGVSCCDSTGSVGARPDCDAHPATYAEAVEVCSDSGYRLCTLDEMLSEVTLRTGCGYDVAYNWVSDECTSSSSAAAVGADMDWTGELGADSVVVLTAKDVAVVALLVATMGTLVALICACNEKRAGDRPKVSFSRVPGDSATDDDDDEEIALK